MFAGFPPDLIGFFHDLRLRNDRDWFATQKARYERAVLEPSKVFVLALGELLLPIAPGVQADPRVNRSLFRIQRDTRFANDKTPYKTNLGLWLWEGVGPRMACSGFYVHVDPPLLMLGVGLYQFSEPLLAAYRDAVVSEVHGPALIEAARAVTGAGPYTLGGRTWKRVPRGYDKTHPRADWLLYGGLYAGIEMPIPPVFHEPGFPAFCANHYRKMLPLHAWLLELTQRA